MERNAILEIGWFSPDVFSLSKGMLINSLIILVVVNYILGTYSYTRSGELTAKTVK